MYSFVDLLPFSIHNLLFANSFTFVIRTMELVFATNNKHKIEEVQHLLQRSPDGLKNKFQLLSLKDINCNEELPETGNTMEENALQKAKYVHEKLNVDCFADDTGLEINALNGRPGVYSARYSGEECSAKKNIKKVLEEMANATNRNASFKAIIALIINDKEYLFEGVIDGIILSNPRGKLGFGYDPIFQPKGYQKTFAEMTTEEKSKISHRAIAVKKLIEFLNQVSASSIALP